MFYGVNHAAPRPFTTPDNVMQHYPVNYLYFLAFAHAGRAATPHYFRLSDRQSVPLYRYGDCLALEAR